MNDGNAHSELGCHSSTPSLHSLTISLMRTSCCIFGTGNARPWYGFEPPLSERRQALFSSHLKCSQNAPHILWEAAVTHFVDRRLDACNISTFSMLPDPIPYSESESVFLDHILKLVHFLAQLCERLLCGIGFLCAFLGCSKSDFLFPFVSYLH